MAIFRTLFAVAALACAVMAAPEEDDGVLVLTE